MSTGILQVIAVDKKIQIAPDTGRPMLTWISYGDQFANRLANHNARLAARARIAAAPKRQDRIDIKIAKKALLAKKRAEKGG